LLQEGAAFHISVQMPHYLWAIGIVLCDAAQVYSESEYDCLYAIDSIDMGGDVHLKEAEGRPKKRELVWSGLAARCSGCRWQRVYDPKASKHHMPNDGLSEIIRREFEDHNCQDYRSAD
jgi:hypothetical protein